MCNILKYTNASDTSDNDKLLIHQPTKPKLGGRRYPEIDRSELSGEIPSLSLSYELVTAAPCYGKLWPYSQAMINMFS